MVGRVSSGEVLVVGAELLVDVEVVEVTSPSVAGESTAMKTGFSLLHCFSCNPLFLITPYSLKRSFSLLR